ncbi:lysozyme inhibitor LprI family protein [Hafnia paralvei]|uniref:DUF1311 domain-containing protein n=1 Tax=Salmonella enterica I TaxID=59201 RepID=A0A5Y3M6Z1_SALET|nr:hypothetical protein [Salmonella enterica subsp. enterica]
MLNLNSVLFIVVAVGLPASALAMDCNKATLKDEVAICGDTTLMQLDAVLNKNYISARQHSDKDILKTQQLSWLKQRQQCGDDTGCLGNSYVERIKTLAEKDNVSVIHNASKQWDFVLSVSACNKDDSYPTCEGPGMLDIFTKGTDQLVQRIPMDNLFIELDAKGKATANLVEMYGDNNSGLVSEDINFDGSDDIALRAGNEGAYGGPSYDVFLYQPKSKTFKRHEALTELGSTNLGLFDVDPKLQTLTTSTKSGCCWHQFSVWKIKNNQPLLIKEITEDASPGEKPDFMTITTTIRTLVNGKWKTSESKDQVPE